MRMQRQVRRMAQMSGPATTAPVNEPTLRLTLLSQGQSVATLVLWTDTALWQRPGQPGLLSGIGPAEAQALLQPAQQALAAGNSAPPD
jgi:hypothetical protein